MNLLQNFHLVVIEYLYRESRGPSADVLLDSNRKLSIVMALSTNLTQCSPKFGKLTQNRANSAASRGRSAAV